MPGKEVMPLITDEILIKIDTKYSGKMAAQIATAKAQLAADQKVLEAEKERLHSRYKGILADQEREFKAQRKEWAKNEAVWLDKWFHSFKAVIPDETISEMYGHIAKLRQYVGETPSTIGDVYKELGKV